MRTKKLCQLAMMTAMLNLCKWVIPIPNVEVVTSLFVSYAVVLRVHELMMVAFCFVFVEILLWGFALWWVLTYLLYWPCLCLGVRGACRLVSNPQNQKQDLVARCVLAVIVGMIFVLGFGFVSTFCETVVFRGIADPQFEVYFAIRYLNGLPFFVTNIVTNLVVMPLIVPGLSIALQRVMAR
ncbi:MAG: hypothetical protein FWD76_05370 [Firmicutes bacterium]|nr:hypothetical protein [Bacillota bacterium]